MDLPRDYWETYEETVTTLSDYVEIMQALTSTWPARRFVWRGVVDAGYALHSSLYRRVLNARGALPETDFLSDEENIVAEAKEWSLHRTPNDRLSALELLAGLQHQGVPTRLLDFSHNALVALWFAVEQRFDDTGQPLPDIDGRVFVAQSNGREVNPAWERAPDLPWSDNPPVDWLRDIFIWTPPPIDPRMARQQGCFVFAGVPSTTGVWNVRDGNGSRQMLAAEIRACVSVPIRLNSTHYVRHDRASGKRPGYPLAFTFRIPADEKQALRAALERGLGFTHAMMYPDFPGFGAYGRSILRP